ncbi:MAG: hypothetical protein LBP61_09340 [Desulfovibrio sp.]|jgi:hypothetical protein|nr:hypothetical protein [Desulfovibrio sp.]
MKGSTKKTLGIVLVALLVVAAAAAFIGVPWWEKRQEERARAFLEGIGLRAEGVKASFFGNSLVFTKVSGDIPLDKIGLNYALNLETVTASGLDLLAGQRKGLTTLADSLVCSNALLTVTFLGEESTATIKEMAAKGIRLDLGSILEALKSPSPPREILSRLEDIFRLDHMVYTDYTVTMDAPFGPVSIHIDKMEGRDVGVLNCGPMDMENMTIRALGSEVYSLRHLGLSEMRVPNVLSLLAEKDDLGDFTPENFLKLLEKTPFVLEGLTFQDMKVQSPVGGEKISLGDLNLSLSFGTQAAGLDFALNDLSLPGPLLEDLVDILEEAGVEPGESFLFSGNLSSALKRDGGRTDLTFSAGAGEKSLGKVSLGGEFFLGEAGNILEALLAEDYRVRSLAFSLTDTGSLQRFAEFQYRTGKEAGYLDESVKGPEDILRQLAEEAAADVDEDDARAVPGLAPALKAFLQGSGTLSVTLRAEPPLSVEDLQFLDLGEMQKKGVTLGVEYKP